MSLSDCALGIALEGVEEGWPRPFPPTFMSSEGNLGPILLKTPQYHLFLIYIPEMNEPGTRKQDELGSLSERTASSRVSEVGANQEECFAKGTLGRFTSKLLNTIYFRCRFSISCFRGRMEVYSRLNFSMHWYRQKASRLIILLLSIAISHKMYLAMRKKTI